GIRPIRLTHPVAKPLDSTISIDDTHRSNVRRHRVKTSVNTVAIGSFKNRLLNAVKEALSDYENSSQRAPPIYMDSSERLRHNLPQVVTPTMPRSTNTLAKIRQPLLVE
uniref:Uncharacterized protein n=1 Tax=Parascaris univalens TaxID=6257 RepID=A0A915C947_PARUN